MVLKKKDGGGWRADWVKKYNNGHRGIIAIYLMTDRLDEVREELKSRGIPVSESERVSFRWFELIKRCIEHYPHTEWLDQTTDKIANFYEKIGFSEYKDVF